MKRKESEDNPEVIKQEEKKKWNKEALEKPPENN